MLTIHLQWTLPTTRTDGSPLAPTDIGSVNVQDLFANTLHQLPGTAVSFDTGDVTGQVGDHSFNVTVTDTAGNVSAPASVSVTVSAPLAAPSPVTGLTGTLVTS